jgi:hypothetical protein
LKHLDYSRIEDCREQFYNLIENIKTRYKTPKVIENPSYFIRMGNAFIEHADTYKMRILNAIGFHNLIAQCASSLNESIAKQIKVHDNSDRLK